jgi:hypothetical protein
MVAPGLVTSGRGIGLAFGAVTFGMELGLMSGTILGFWFGNVEFGAM